MKRLSNTPWYGDEGGGKRPCWEACLWGWWQPSPRKMAQVHLANCQATAMRLKITVRLNILVVPSLLLFKWIYCHIFPHVEYLDRSFWLVTNTGQRFPRLFTGSATRDPLFTQRGNSGRITRLWLVSQSHNSMTDSPQGKDLTQTYRRERLAHVAHSPLDGISVSSRT